MGDIKGWGMRGRRGGGDNDERVEVGRRWAWEGNEGGVEGAERQRGGDVGA